MGRGDLSNEILEALEREIVGGVHAVGSTLPTEAELCRRFAVSRTTIRKATKVLREKGLIEPRPRIGMKVVGGQGVPGSRVVSVMHILDGLGIEELQDYLQRQGYLPRFYSQAREDWKPEAERAFLQRVLDGRHRGLVAFCTPLAPRNEELLRQLDEAGVHVVHVGHFRDTLPDQSFVLPDGKMAGTIAALGLAAAGHKDLYFARLDSDGPLFYRMEAGFAEALRTVGRSFDPVRQVLECRWIFKRQWDLAPVKEFLKRIRPPAAVFARSTDLARLFVEMVRARGLRCPEDVAVIASEEFPDVNREVPVDTLAFDGDAIIRRAVEAATRPRSQGIHELVAPTLLRGTEVRVLG